MKKYSTMRNYLLLSFFVILMTACHKGGSQQPTEDAPQVPKHMSFKGVELGINTKDFMDSLLHKGFHKPRFVKDEPHVKGEFAGYKQCRVYPAGNQKGNVYKIFVQFHFMDDWQELYGCYNDLKAKLAQKYGEPTMCEEEFTTKKEPKEDKDKLRAVKSDACNYQTEYTAPQGTVLLKIDHVAKDCYISLTYLDNEAGEEEIEAEAARQEQIMKDL